MKIIAIIISRNEKVERKKVGWILTVNGNNATQQKPSIIIIIYIFIWKCSIHVDCFYDWASNAYSVFK